MWNDASGLVLYKFAVAAVLTGAFSPGRASLEFVGVSVGGSAIRPNNAANQAFYGKSVQPADILVRRNVSNPESASLRRSLQQVASAK